MSAFLPPPAVPIGHRQFLRGALDAHGNPTKAWADAVTVLVHGWHTGQSEEPQISGHERLRVDGQVVAPETWRPDPRDKVVIPGVGEFYIIGLPEDHNHGPFGFRPGLMINIQRVTG